MSAKGLCPDAFTKRDFKIPVNINADADSLLRSLAKAGKTPVAQTPLRGAGDVQIGS